ncbi:MAG: hypothetical protein HYZ88_01795 [Candidatus Omnitrophica bacterium]|nr:hypothetical protein [Candidatus Omnitrophota bacterium]
MNPSLRFILFLMFLSLVGCSRGMTNIERPKGEIELRRPETLSSRIRVGGTPIASLTKGGIDATIRYASPEELEKFFENKEVFGALAGKNPYPKETLVFYLKIANHSGKKIRVNPDDFVLIDNLNIQYAELSPDSISALYESKAGLWSFARTTGDMAPGYYGAPLKVAGSLGAGSGRKQHYLIKQVRLAPGTIHPGIAYDGYVAFPRPHPNATSVRILVDNIKTDFNAADIPESAIHFEFPFQIEISPVQAGEQPSGGGTPESPKS